MSLEIKRIIESLAAERAQISLDVAVAFHVTVEQPLEAETLRAEVASESGLVVAARGGFNLLGSGGGGRKGRDDGSYVVIGQRVLHPVTSIDELQGHTLRKAKLWRRSEKIGKSVKELFIYK